MAQPHTGTPTTGDPWLDLFAAIFRQAIKDAKRGDTDAACFLDATLPEWRQIENRDTTLWTIKRKKRVR